MPTSTGTERLKIVVRRLPPNLPEDIFWQSVQPWVTDDTVIWKTFCAGKLRTKRLNKQGIPSRAYIVFKTEALVAHFSHEYDGHVFRDKAGNASCAIVEFAPFPKVPTEKKKADARNNTIDKDEDYISFCDSLKHVPKTESVTLDALIAASQPPPAPTTTPLLEALKADRSAQRDKEAILRNHTHYKDATASIAASKKEEAKKKAAVQAAKQQQQQQQQPEAPAPLSKKAKKAAAAAAVAHKASQVQDGQGSSSAGKGQVPATAPSTSTVKPSLPVTIVAPPSRQRAPKETQGRSHLAKGDVAIPAPAPTPLPTSPTVPTPVHAGTEGALGSPVGSTHHGPRGKGRPVIGLGRHFEAALNGAGVAVAPGSSGERKKRDKGAESGAGQQRGDVHKAQAAAVPSILQRPDMGGGLEPVAVVQRAPSPGGLAGQGHGEGAGTVRGSRRGRGRGRGGHRGG